MATELGGSKMVNIIKAKEDMNKSPEQLDSEKQDIIKSRLVRLKLDGETKDKLERQAKNFHELLGDLYDIIYDLNEKNDRQKYDMMELTKRAIQVEKGKSKTRKSNIVHTGLGGSIFPWLTDVSPNAPGKISLFSRYERVIDRRSFANRREIWEYDQEKERKAAASNSQPKIDANTKARREAFEHKEEQPKPIQRREPVHHREPTPEVVEEHNEEEQHEEEQHEEEQHGEEEEHQEKEQQHESEHEQDVEEEEHEAEQQLHEEEEEDEE